MHHPINLPLSPCLLLVFFQQFYASWGSYNTSPVGSFPPLCSPHFLLSNTLTWWCWIFFVRKENCKLRQRGMEKIFIQVCQQSGQSFRRGWGSTVIFYFHIKRGWRQGKRWITVPPTTSVWKLKKISLHTGHCLKSLHLVCFLTAN